MNQRDTTIRRDEKKKDNGGWGFAIGGKFFKKKKITARGKEGNQKREREENGIREKKPTYCLGKTRLKGTRKQKKTSKGDLCHGKADISGKPTNGRGSQLATVRSLK